MIIFTEICSQVRVAAQPHCTEEFRVGAAVGKTTFKLFGVAPPRGSNTAGSEGLFSVFVSFLLTNTF